MSSVLLPSARSNLCEAPVKHANYFVIVTGETEHAERGDSGNDQHEQVSRETEGENKAKPSTFDGWVAETCQRIKYLPKRGQATCALLFFEVVV